ncbi:craniofacial development protein 1 [Myripristis murdjan]|uniref:Craniofacial development protein 1 n=1 Tax=Myripristis murdjan TaxID=586833 RepID=A0A668A131_9TELE|nr:craniofacial development protein 1 [Myripristis murdjan]
MTSYSDYDSDGYSSNEDADYVPSDDNLSEDDINECEREEPLDESEEVPHAEDAGKQRKKRKGKELSVRKRKKGVLKVEEGQEPDGVQEEKPQEEFEEAHRTKVAEEDDDERKKKKADDLWASFLSDVGSRPKASTPAPPASSTLKADSSVSKVSPSCAEAKASEPTTVTITKVFDFAGEEVRVTKEVSADSREAKGFLKSQTAEQEEQREESSSSPGALLPGPSAKRPSGVSSLLSRIGGKKQKMSTLEKSKMDWDAFKTEEGINDELAIHNRGKDGYMERKNFLERVDHRQFELEKAVRLSNMKR